jgi:hypothetical protein
MMSSYFGCFYTPEEISRKYEWYTSDGLIIWDKLFFPCVKFMIRDYRYSPELVKKAIKDPKQAVLLQVNDGQHWVIGAKYNLFGRLMAVDPWDGKLCDVLSKYRNITGAAYFKSK